VADFLTEIERCIPSLRRYARALMRDRERADDLVQDCLERAISRRRLWRPSGSLRAWLFTILHNLYANEVRRQSTQPGLVSVDEIDMTLSRPEEQTDGLIMRDVSAALDRLATEQREVLLLVALEGLSYAEVAAVQGVPIGTVMSRLSRARERLGVLLDGDPASRIRRIK
jgi:RNA polymerase sigma-70 factor (ECF subfamily)